MKIGIITYHSVYNFGANLQAYSTIGYLRNNGFEPVIINWIAADLEAGYNKSNPPEQIKAHKDFIEEYLPCTKLCRTTADVVSVIKIEGISAIIIGSDAVLQHRTYLARMRFTRQGITLRERRSNLEFPNPFWGSFITELEPNFPVMLMSASSQNTNFKLIRGRLRREMGEALLRFKHITVRDEWTRNMVAYLTRGKINSEVTPDPVFGFNQNTSTQNNKSEILKNFNLPERYVLLSFKNKWVVDEAWLESFQSLLKNEGIGCVILTMPGGVIFTNTSLKVLSPPLSPIDWYNLIKYSSGFVGENMHPIVVAIHNAVPFFSFDSYGIVKYKFFVKENSSKIYDILKIGEFLNYRMSTLGRNYNSPSPEEVILKLKAFDQMKCEKFRSLQHQKYVMMMQSILEFKR